MEATVEDTKSNLEIAENLGLLPSEFEKIKEIALINKNE